MIKKNKGEKKNKVNNIAILSFMNKQGCVIIIEDDADDQYILQEIFKDLKYQNEIIFFSDSIEALEFLTTGDKYPFLILSDLNMPKLSGLELMIKLKTDADIHLKCIPYIYFTGSSNHNDVMSAYSTSAQGFVTKAADIPGLEKQIKVIMEYWMQCSVPNHLTKKGS